MTWYKLFQAEIPLYKVDNATFDAEDSQEIVSAYVNFIEYLHV